MENIFQKQTAANASLHCLRACGVSALPVKPVRIAMHYGVQCLDYATPLQRGEGGRIIRRADGRVQIVLDPSQPAQRRRFAVVHELGHYLLGHLDRPPQPADEYAADCFAAGVLMPACVLRGLHGIMQTTSHIYAVSHVEPQKRGQGISSGYIGGVSFRHTRWSRKSSGSLRAF